MRAFKNLKYLVRNDHGATEQTELDGLLIFDTVLLLVEGKSGSLSLPARRGGKDRMQTEIKELVEHAYKQCLRARRYIQENEKPTFTLADGTTVEIPKERINQIFLITVSLDSLDTFVTALYQLRDLGLFSDGDLPWAVSLADLRAISEVIEFPSQLVDYLNRRRRLNELGRLVAHDELDWFGHYLKEGLIFDHIFENEGGPDRMQLLSYTTELDSYFFYKMGARNTPAPRPCQPMPRMMREVLSDLEQHHPPGYLATACALLDMSSEAREQFATSVEKCHQLCKSDGRLHDFTMILGEMEICITCMFATASSAEKLQQRLPGYCQMKKYQTKSDKWVGIGFLVDVSGTVHAMVVLNEPWKFDRELDELVAKHLRPMSETAGPFDKLSKS